MAEVTLTASMRSNLYSLQQTANLMGTVQNRLSTGKKVNSALDNPNNYFTAQALTNRASDINSLLDGMGQAIQAIKTATQGIESAQKTIDQLKATATSAIQSIKASNASSAGTLYTRSNVTASMTSLVTQLTSTATPPVSQGVAAGNQFTVTDGTTTTTVTVNQGMTMADLGKSLSDATNGDVTLSVDSSGKFSVRNGSATKTWTFAETGGTPITGIFGGTAVTSLTAGLGTGATVSADANLNSDKIVAATAATVLFNTAANGTFGAGSSNLTNAAGTQVTTAGTDTFVITLGSGANSTQHTIKMSADLGADGGVATVGDLLKQLNNISGVNASLDANGKLSISATSGQALKVSDSGSGTLAALGFTVGSTISATNAAPDASYAAQFDTLRTQLDQLVRDASYQGINLLSGSNNSPLTVTFNEAATSANKLVINAVDVTSAGLGLTAVAGKWNNAADVQSTLANLTAASSTLRTQAQNFGTNLTTVQNRQDFTNNMIATLKEGADKLTLADMNEEGANMLALQTRSQLGTQSLSLASQANQAVMRLFG